MAQGQLPQLTQTMTPQPALSQVSPEDATPNSVFSSSLPKPTDRGPECQTQHTAGMGSILEHGPCVHIQATPLANWLNLAHLFNLSVFFKIQIIVVSHISIVTVNELLLHVKHLDWHLACSKVFRKGEEFFSGACTEVFRTNMSY